MKKSLKMFRAAFAALLIASFAAVFACPAAAEESRPSGKPVSNEAEFLAMERGGEYYLANDITLTKSYTSIFTGTLNGNGKTITLKTVTAFSEFNGTVRDLTFEGAVTTKMHTGSLTAYTGGMTAYNVVNRASITSSAAVSVGGIVGRTRPNARAVFVGCRNYGNLKITAKSGDAQLGGLIGSADSLEAYDCLNYGSLSGASNGANVGGICGYSAFTAGENDVFVFRCSNYGEISSGYNAGGLLSRAGVASNAAPRLFTFIQCENQGAVTGCKYVGGIAGYGYGSDSQRFRLFRCLNTGTVTGGSSDGGFVSHFFAYCNSAYGEIQGCVGIGELKQGSTGTAYTCLFGVSSARGHVSIGIRGNFILEKSCKWLTFALDGTSNGASRVPIERGEEYGALEFVKEEDVATGALTMYLNRKTGFNYFYQDLENGGLPTVRPEAGYVVYDLSAEEDKYINGTEPRLPLPEVLTPADPYAPAEEPEPEVTLPEDTGAADESSEADLTSAPETAEETASAPAGGCASSLPCAVMAVIAFASWAALRKSRNE
ncbi:MAG: hypothetical protein ILO42_08690 [Clostridia bacterium]|nr:hypothetical protein [Clostridia bacterium]